MLDWIAGGFELAGSWVVGNKKAVGFLLNLVGCAIWVVVAVREEIYGLLLVVVPAMFVSVRNYKKWKEPPDE